MFDSKITAKLLIEEIQNEADIAPDIPVANYIQWLNSIEQLLYSEIIKEQGKAELTGSSFSTENPVVSLEELSESDKAVMRFEDIHAIYADKTQLAKSTLASGDIFPNTYYKKGELLGLNIEKQTDMITIIYIVRPALKTPENISTTNVRVPAEFIDLVKAKLRGEAYKLANEDALAAKWVSDYNILLETFKAWIAEKQPMFGL